MIKCLINKILNFFKKLFNIKCDNIIYYTTNDNKPCYINYAYPNPFGDAVVISNTYSKNKGIIKFDKPLKCISGFTFFESHNLETITLPESLESIDSMVFNNNTMKAFYGKFASEDNISLIYNNKLVAVAFAGISNYTVPKEVQSFPNIFFNLKRKDLIVTLDNYCGSSHDFYHSYIQLISNINNIPDRAFEDNVFSKITLGENTKTIGKHAFMRSRADYYYDIPLYNSYSNNCDIICKAENPPILGDEYVFGSIYPGTDEDWPDEKYFYNRIYVPESSINVYKNKWDKFSNYIHSMSILE